MSEKPDKDASPNGPIAAAEDGVAAPVRAALRLLTANLLRVTRGAGRPEDLLLQTLTLVECINAYRDAMGIYPAPDMLAAQIRLEKAPADTTGGWEEWDDAVHDMVRGALQVAASELLLQPAQARAGRRELFAGYRRIEKMHGRQLRRLLRR